MAEVAYLLCALLSAGCALMLARAYWKTRTRFLIWCAGCFVLLAMNNGLLFVDKVIYPDDLLTFAGMSFSFWRNASAVSGLTLLVFGLIWDAG